MSEKRGYYFVNDQTVYLPEMAALSLSELLDQLESCGYRCEAGGLSLNIAWIELRRRAKEEETIASRLRRLNK